MKVKEKILPRLLLAALAAVLLLQPAAGRAAQKKEPFTQFWTRFKAALAKDDRQSVAAMTKFRVDDTTYLTDKEFLDKWYVELKRERRCFARAKPVKDQEAYMIFCGERIFLFNLIDGEWKFTEIGVND